MPEDLLVLEGAFVVKAEGGNHFLELPGAPLDTFGLLFGPTDPQIWAPTNQNVRVIRAPNGDLTQLETTVVAQELMRIGIST